MTSQRLMKILAIAAILALITAVYIWRSTDEAPSPWLLRFAAISFAGAFILFVVNPQTRPRIMLQFLAALFATLALFTFAADYSAPHTAEASGFRATSVLERLSDLAPTLLAASRNAIIKAVGETLWDPVLTSLLSIPAFLFFLMLAALAGYAGRYRRDVQIVIN